MMSTPLVGVQVPRPRLLPLLIALALVNGQVSAAQPIEFNTDVLDVQERGNIDLKRFARAGYVMPGEYSLALNVNQQELPEQPIQFYPAEKDPANTEACLPASLVQQIGLKEEFTRQLTWWHNGQCLAIGSLEGMTVRPDLGSNTLYLSIPQAYMEYSSPDWDPPARWDDGIPGLLLDYNLNAQTQRQNQNDNVQKGYNLSGNGLVGANAGSWRLRASWQTQIDHQTGSGEPVHQKFEWTQYTAYRAIARLRAKLTLGEDFLNSDIFDSFRYTGVSLVSDDAMLPPNLRGYAPEVSGVARTNARVVVSQQGRVLYETLVPAGPFRIQDLNNAVSGLMDVRIEEQDGSVQAFSISTASIPYLTRPGMIRYKLASGRPTDWRHRTQGPLFASGEFSWGISNGWSLFGGGMAGDEYNALALGIGRDLMAFGALSFDVTQSRARLPQRETLSGGSYRLRYSKNFDQIGGQVTFAGYRFSERSFMTMGEFIEMRNLGVRSQSSKEMYTVSYSQQFRDMGLTANLNYDHQTYWDRDANDRYSLSLMRYFNVGRFKNLSLSLTGYRNQYNGLNDDGVFLSLSLPWGNRGSVSYSGTWNRDDNTHRVSYSDRVGDRGSYQVSSGWTRNGALASGFYSHQADWAQINATASAQSGSYATVGLALQGGATATREGAALHRVAVPGGTRLLVDTDGVADIPIRNYGAPMLTNRYGKAVVADMNSYYRNRVNIDLDQLPDNAEALKSVVQATLTEGAIGYRRFDVIAGEKAMAVIRLADGTMPPFGATVQNMKKRDVGIVNDGGSVYLSGIQRGETMTVHWDERAQCELILPAVLPADGMKELLLPCRALAPKATTTDLAAVQTNAETIR
ncbi:MULTISPECIES: outer membrane usher protein [unclassified Serratia (in: enterobacteria)]|uniref:outer membrane usher protein n=1 Tax=unclassified Serratia (in: enterobacteria) TaxID=2647522 RepID=UPI003FA6F567